MARLARRRRIQKAPVSFFSFLDILGGTIGVLVLIVAVFTMQIKPNTKSVQLLASDDYDVQQKLPSYIICNGGGVLELHHNQEKVYLDLLSKKLDQAIRDLWVNSETRYLIIGVRPNGYDDFEKVRAMAEKSGISIGYEPLDQDWKVRVPRRRVT